VIRDGALIGMRHAATGLDDVGARALGGTAGIVAELRVADASLADGEHELDRNVVGDEAVVRHRARGRVRVGHARPRAQEA
jgi:hypothetical protein